MPSRRGTTLRWWLSGGLVAVGIALVVVTSSPVVDAQVVSSERNPETGTTQVVLVAPDGTRVTTVYYSDAPGVGATVSAVELPGNRLVDSGHASVGRDIGVLLLIAGLGIGLRAWWRARHPNPPSKSLAVPGDTIVLPPRHH